MENKVIYDAANIFNALGDETRLQIMHSIMDEPKTVTEIVSNTNVSQSCVSHQLKFLKELRLVKSERNGRCIYYSFNDDHIIDIITKAFEHVKE